MDLTMFKAHEDVPYFARWGVQRLEEEMGLSKQRESECGKWDPVNRRFEQEFQVVLTAALKLAKSDK